MPDGSGFRLHVFNFANPGSTNISDADVRLVLCSPKASNPMWLGDPGSPLTYGVASEHERVSVLLIFGRDLVHALGLGHHRSRVGAALPWGSLPCSYLRLRLRFAKPRLRADRERLSESDKAGPEAQPYPFAEKSKSKGPLA